MASVIVAIIFLLIQGALVNLVRGDSVFGANTVDVSMGLFTGLWTAVFMSLLIGRFGSRHLDVHPIELCLLYAYACTQPLFPLLRVFRSSHSPSDPNWVLLTQGELWFLVFAGAFKLGMFFVVSRQIGSGRLAFYMREVRVHHTTSKESGQASTRRCVRSASRW